MKKIIILILIIPLLSINIKNDNSKFIGRWIGEDKNQIGIINFDPEGFAYFELNGEIFGGKEFEIKGKKGKMTYEINSQTNPIQIDFIVTKLENGEQNKLYCIAKFIDNDTMKFAISFENTRPIFFVPKNTIILKREK